MIAVLMVWVVLSGMPKVPAVMMVIPAAVSAAKPWIGSSLVRRRPIVLMIRQPPDRGADAHGHRAEQDHPPGHREHRAAARRAPAPG